MEEGKNSKGKVFPALHTIPMKLLWCPECEMAMNVVAVGGPWHGTLHLKLARLCWGHNASHDRPGHEHSGAQATITAFADRSFFPRNLSLHRGAQWKPARKPHPHREGDKFIWSSSPSSSFASFLLFCSSYLLGLIFRYRVQWDWKMRIAIIGSCPINKSSTP